MIEVSTALSGKFSSPDYVAAVNNLNPVAAAVDSSDLATADKAGNATPVGATTSTDNSASVDTRRYTKFDHSVTDAGEDTTFSFSDFLDMINPLQHIPVVSSIYRAATGDSINPVSRVAGDIMYGGALGAVSAVMGGVGAIGDAVMESQTGKDKTGQVVAALFGTDSDKTTQLASNDSEDTSADTVTQSQVAAAAPVTPVVMASMMAPAPTTSAPTAAATPTSVTTSLASAPGSKGLPLDRSKMPYGGVMDTGNSFAAQNMAMALAESSHAVQLGHTIYTGRLMTGAHALPVAAASTTATQPMTTPTTTATIVPTTIDASAFMAANPTPTAATTPAPTTIASPTVPAAAADEVAASSVPASEAMRNAAHNPIPQALIDDMVMLKKLNQYHNVATGPASVGANLNITN